MTALYEPKRRDYVGVQIANLALRLIATKHYRVLLTQCLTDGYTHRAVCLAPRGHVRVTTTPPAQENR